MVNNSKYILVTLLAFLIFYGGAGVNLISYCCDECRSAGWEVLVDDKCCDIHNHEHSCDHPEINHNCSTNAFDKSTCCDLERVDFEWDNTENPEPELEPAVTDLFDFGTITASLFIESFQADILHPDAEAPPLIGNPRHYLSLLTTLLI